MLQSTGRNVIRRGWDSSDASSNQKRGRKRKLSRRSIIALLKYTRKIPFQSATTIASEFIEYSRLTISTKTVRRFLHDNVISNYVVISKPHLSKKNLHAGMRWAKEYTQWSNEEWNRTVFSKESSRILRPKWLRKAVWREENRKYHPSNIVPTFKSGKP